MSESRKNVARFEFDLGDSYGCYLYALVARAINHEKSGPGLPPEPVVEPLTQDEKQMRSQYLTIIDSHKILDRVNADSRGSLELRIEDMATELIALRRKVEES